MTMKLHEQLGDLRADKVLADTDCQAPRWYFDRRHRTILQMQQFARDRDECRAIDGQTDVPGRTLEEPPPQLPFEPLHFHAHGGLTGLQPVGRSREAAQIGREDEGAYGVEIKCVRHTVISNTNDENIENHVY